MPRPALMIVILILLAAGSARAWNPFEDLDEAVGDIGKAIEKGAQDTGKAVDKAVRDLGKAIDGIGNGGAPDVEATRIFAGPGQYPPTAFAAYAIIVFKSRASRFDQERHGLICEAYVSTLPHYTEVELPLNQQIVTVWPVDSDSVSNRINLAPRAKVCQMAVDHYNLVVANRARDDAELVGANFDRRGPFLIAWAPGLSKGDPEAIVLQADLSHVTNIDQAKSVFEHWVEDIEEDPSKWPPSKGWDLEKIRVAIRNWLDDFGEEVLKVFG